MSVITKPLLPAAEDPPDRMRQALLVIGLSFFVTTLGNNLSLKLPFQFLLKNTLHIEPQGMAPFFALSGFAWYFKPVAGFFSDSVPLFGTRRRSYLLLCALGAGALWLVTAVVPRQYAPLLGMMIAVNALVVVGSSVTGGLLAERGQASGATGRLSAWRNVTFSGAALAAGPIGGYLAARPFGLTCAFAAALFFLLVPAVLLLLHEPRQVRDASEGRRARAQFLAQVQTLRAAKPLWVACAFMFLLYLAPGFLTPLFYYQTGTLHFSSGFIGRLAVISGALGISGSLLYGWACRRLPLRVLLASAIVFYALAALSYLGYRSQAAAQIIEGIYGLGQGLIALAMFDLAARATPRGSEALAYSLMMSVLNIGSQLSDVLGSYLYGHYHVPFLRLVWVNAATTAVTLVLLPLLPRALLDRPDQDAEAVPAASVG